MCIGRRTIQISKTQARTAHDTEKDSLRFYNLGNNYQTKIEHIGAKAGYQPEGLLML